MKYIVQLVLFFALFLANPYSVFDNFIKLYFEIYKEKYPNDFRSLVDNGNTLINE